MSRAFGSILIKSNKNDINKPNYVIPVSFCPKIHKKELTIELKKEYKILEKRNSKLKVDDRCHLLI